MTNVTVCLKIN